ncbi:MAG: DUF983 domain-containing protein [Chitinophagaceae bacterium]|nr:DUF983 domain-containing protein [Chitinophagaceae bacterium]
MFAYIKNILSQKCPRCHRGKMFTHKWYQLKYVVAMPDKCANCGQRTEIEQGFYYGTGYVSYALTVAFTVATFIAWWVLIGLSINDNRIFWWLGTNVALLVIFQPWFMRTSRLIWLSWFFHKDDDKHKKNNAL